MGSMLEFIRRRGEETPPKKRPETTSFIPVHTQYNRIPSGGFDMCSHKWVRSKIGAVFSDGTNAVCKNCNQFAILDEEGRRLDQSKTLDKALKNS